MTTRLTLQQYIIKAKAVHGEIYDYTKTRYINNHSPVTILCPFHGEFRFAEAKSHTVHKKGCVKCSYIDRKIKSLPTSNKYIVMKFLSDNHKLVKVICKIHNEEKIVNITSPVLQNPDKVFCKQCKDFNTQLKKLTKKSSAEKPKASVIKKPPSNKKTIEDFIKESESKWGKGTFTYENTVYNGSSEKILVNCGTCRNLMSFRQPYMHFKDTTRCYPCELKLRAKNYSEIFKKLSNDKYNGKYDYSLLPKEFKRTDNVTIVCPLHGPFKQTPANHLKTTFGCQKCGAENSCGYSRTDYINKCNGREPILYLVHFELNSEEFYKIGITVNSISRRFRGYRSPYNHTLIDYIQGEAGFIFDTEKQIQKALNRYSYTPSLHMEGTTECFLLDTSVLASFQNLKQTIN